MTDVSVGFRPPYLCPSEGHKHGVSIQTSLNLGDTLLRIAREWKTAEAWFLARLFILQSSIISQILEYIYWEVTILVLITWLVKTENTSYIYLLIRLNWRYNLLLQKAAHESWYYNSRKSEKQVLLTRMSQFGAFLLLARAFHGTHILKFAASPVMNN